MANTLRKNNKSALGSIVKGMAGAAAVAGVAVAVTRALKNKKTRDNVKKTMSYMKGKAMDYVKTLETDKKVKKTLAKVSRRKVGMPTLKASAKKNAKKVKKVTK